MQFAVVFNWRGLCTESTLSKLIGTRLTLFDAPRKERSRERLKFKAHNKSCVVLLSERFILFCFEDCVYLRITVSFQLSFGLGASTLISQLPLTIGGNC